MEARRPHIFVAGSTNEKISEEYNIAAQKIGKAICENKYTLVFDGAYGLPGLAAAQFLGKEDVNFENGMGISMGRLREDKIYDYKFIGLSHNTVRGAAGGAILCAELLTAQGYISAK